MKTLASALVLLLTACGSPGARRQGQAAQAAAVPVFECAVDGASVYGTGCAIARKPVPGGAILTLRSPTGSFRRLRVGGGKLAAEDGAEPARILGGDKGRVEVAIGGDRYLIPRESLR